MAGASTTSSSHLESVVERCRGAVRFYSKLPRQGKFGVIVMSGIVLMAVFAPLIAPQSPYFQNYDHIHAAPSMDHPLGTDHVGRDVLSRIIYGARVSLAVASLAVLWSTVVGSIAGGIGAYRGGLLDDVIMRIADSMLAFPAIVIAIALVALLPPSIPTLAFAIGFSYAAKYARLIRGEVLSVKEESYIEAAEGVGMSERNILLREVLPNSFQPVLVQMSFQFPLAVLAEAGLSFLGLGVSAPTPTWGTMIKFNQPYMPEVWWPVFAAGVAIFLTAMSFNLVGDAVQDVWDPYTDTEL